MSPTKEDIQQAIEQRLEKDEKLKAWFEQFRKSSWDNFISTYAHTKSLALKYPDLHKDDFKPKNKLYNGFARQALEDIQQKKLFNLQCQWRADSLELPFIQVAYDFELFASDIMNCPFLPPVEWDEVELFIQFLKSPNSSEYFEHECCEPQCYDTFKEEQETGQFGETPAWYEFYDAMRGTGYLLNLPNIRGEKEEYYREVYRDHRDPDRHAPRPHNPELDKPSPHGAEFEIDFANQFEEPEMAETIIAMIKSLDHHDSHEFLDEHYEELKKIPGTFPLVHHHDWREAIRLTVAQYKAEQVAEALPRIWRQYIREVGDDREAYVSRRIANTSKDILEELDRDKMRKYFAGYVLKGRKLLGEPEDFDF